MLSAFWVNPKEPSDKVQKDQEFCENLGVLPRVIDEMCPRIYVMPENARCTPGADRTTSETDTSTTRNINSVNDKISKLEEEKTSITMSIARQDGGITESDGETRWQHLHLQLRSGKPHNGKQVGAHGSPHHLSNGGDFVFLERLPENRRGVWTVHP